MRWYHCVILFLLVSCPLHADGGFKSHVLKPVAIPQQVAALSHKEGKETLTIWNTVESVEKDLAWVLPLPAVPDTIQETDANALRLLQRSMAPTVETASGGISVALVFASIMAVGASLMIRKRPTGKDRVMLLLLFLLPLSIFITVPAMSGVFGNASPVVGVQVLLSQETDHYQASVISGDSAGGINQWLVSQGFAAFDAEELAVVSQYLNEKWVFLGARIKPAAAGLAEVPPLTVRFPAPEPVYPMRLTRWAGTVPVDLYVIGDSWMSDPTGRLTTQATAPSTAGRRYSAFHDLKRKLSEASMIRELAPMARKPNLLSYATPYEVPEAGTDLLLDTLLAPQLHLTHLKGTFTPGSDWDDIKLTRTTELQDPVKYYTVRAFVAEMGMIVAGGGALVFFVLGVLAHLCTKKGNRPRKIWPVLVLTLWANWTVPSAYAFWKEAVVVKAAAVTPGSRDGTDSVGTFLEQWMNAMADRKSGKAEPPPEANPAQ